MARAQEIANDLRQAIRSGSLAPGAVLPSERELVQRYQVSKTTVAKALSILRGEGLIVSEVGRGIFVRQRLPMMAISASYIAPTADGTWPSWKSEAAQFGMEGTQRLVYVGAEDVPDEAADAFGGSDSVVVRRRIMFLDGVPVQIANSYYPREIAEGTPLAEDRKISGGASALLAELGHRAHECVETVTARMPTRDEADQLQLGDGVPVIEIVRTSTTSDDRPIEVLVMTLAADRHRLLYRLPVYW